MFQQNSYSPWLEHNLSLCLRGSRVKLSGLALMIGHHSLQLCIASSASMFLFLHLYIFDGA